MSSNDSFYITKEVVLFFSTTFQLSVSYDNIFLLLVRVAQLVMCLATDACLTANPGVASSILARSHTFVEIGREIIFYGHSPPFR